LLRTIGLPELIAASPQDYQRRAISLPRNPDELAAIRRKLAANRTTSPLFDTSLFARRLEAAYAAMHERYQAGLPTANISIA
jgi:protein O-GlcNAc transferase